MYKVAVIGDRDSIYGFAALGLDTYSVDGREEAARILKNSAEGNYAVIYVTESLFADLKDQIERYTTSYLPAIIPIPGVAGNTGIGMGNVKKSVERAVGSDIIFNT
ncbi:MAG: V-type ATP synthase subunit F [Clostridiales bacterium]|nr:V-type ATP synthase subunit F [Clostridiales bacterium]